MQQLRIGQMEQFVSPTQAHGVRFVPEVLNGVFETLLPLPLFGVPGGFS